MIIKSTENEFEVMVQLTSGPGKNIETRLAVKNMPSQLNLSIGRFGRIQNREVVSVQLPFDDGLALYKFLKRRFGPLVDDK